ncbi:hypothetical protein TD95_002237 [Thielaviopsis punctulata]|uniref:Thioredoxin domain-containing protein n=1 Tax=Thielaviopsis punctulata TaxID=72032 RepID=A0A0F4ZDE8_9PEZI|nr:hypothetical protein TD95_002237 [Thielaviopsis punctulata]
MSVVEVKNMDALKALFASHTYVAIDFYATWCPPCKMISPIFEKLAAAHAADEVFAFAKINVDEVREAAAAYNVTAMPTFMFFKEGQQVAVNGHKLIRGADVNALTGAMEKLGGLAKKRLAEL